jgi:hypothetical protein
MSTSPDIERELDDDTYRRVRMGMLAEAAVISRPRMFAIHGVCRGPDTTGILGWGLEFPDGEGAIYADPTDGDVHNTDTAQQVLDLLAVVADVRLTWLDHE